MPILGYCLWVGGVLLALTFVADFYLPTAEPRTEVPRTYDIPIKAAQIGPRAISFSGETRHFGAPPPMTVVDLAARKTRTAEASKPTHADARAQAHAEIDEAAPAARPKAKPTRKKVAKRRVNRDHDVARMNRDRDFAYVPQAWQRSPFGGMAFARPFGLGW